MATPHSIKRAKLRDENGIIPESNNGIIGASIDVWSISNPQSVVNLLPPSSSLKEYVKTIPDEYKNLSSEDMRELAEPSATLNQLRLSFWGEYDRILGTGNRMALNNILNGICTINASKKLLSDPVNMAWLMTPIQVYDMQVQEITETLLYKMRTAVGKLKIENTKDLNTLMKMYEMFDKRVHGDYVQKIESKKIVENKKSVINEMEKFGINNNTVTVKAIEVKDDK